MSDSSHVSGYNQKATNCGRCGVVFSEEHPRCSDNARWAVCKDCYNQHNRVRRRKHGGDGPIPLYYLRGHNLPQSTNCNACGISFTEQNPRCKNKSGVCRPCFNRRRREWLVTHKELAKERKEEYRVRRIKEARNLVWDAYGRACACCGETRDRFLTLEHRNGGGSKHRKERGTLGVLLDIIKAGFPLDFCLYCMNCNFATANGNHCPHELERRQQAIAAD